MYLDTEDAPERLVRYFRILEDGGDVVQITLHDLYALLS